MTVPGSPQSDPAVGTPPQDTTVLLSEQRLDVGSEWLVNGVLRLRRDVQTETQLVEVTVRREVLHIDYDQVLTLDPTSGAPVNGSAVAEPDEHRDPLVIVLRQEVPQVSVVAVPYERVTATFSRQRTQQAVQEVLSREHVVLDTTPNVQVHDDRQVTDITD